LYSPTNGTWARLLIGSVGQVLESDGTDISWQTPSGGTSDRIEEGDSKVEIQDSGTGSIAFYVDSLGSAKANMFASGFNLTSMNLFMFGNEITNAGNITFTLGGDAVTTSQAGFYSDNVNLIAQVPSADGFLWKIAGNTEFGIGSTTINFNNNKGINALDPTSNQDVATKKYVDDNAGGTISGIYDVMLPTVYETSHYDHEVWISNIRAPEKDADHSSSPVFSTVPTDAIWYVPIFIGRDVNVHRLGIDTGSPDIDNMRLGLYDSYPNENYPRTKIHDVGGTINPVGGTGIFSMFFDDDISAGLYWIAVWYDGGNTTTARIAPMDSVNMVGWATDNDDDGHMIPLVAYVELSHTADSMPTTADDDMLEYISTNFLPITAFALLREQ
jgi:hypothetical protein